MFGSRKLKTQVQQPAPPVESASGGEVRYLVSDKKHRARRVASPLRLLGNLLIIFGLLLLLGIGGWYGFTEWSNKQYVAEVEKKFGSEAFEPSIEATPKPTVATLPTPIPLPVLSGTSIATKMGTILNTPTPVAIDNSPPVRLYIPSVKIDTKVVPVGWNMIPAPGGGVKSEWQVADYAVGHHAGSANPGEKGNVVLSGHVDYKGQVFKDLNKVNKGDEVVMYTEKGQYIYVVTDLKIVREEGVSEAQKRENARFMDPTKDLTLTMITCWPYGIDTHRLIVIAKPYQSALSTQSEFKIR
jgi:sortase A